jgi:sterol desaturase/sphingolipid hydroxylase (fatty acid hydroxylase superfamily)
MPKQKLFIGSKDMPDEKMNREIFTWFYVFNPHIVFYVYTPVAVALLAYSFLGTSLVWWEILLGIGASMAFWTVFEYSMHRYAFHWEPQAPFWKKMTYTAHHGHHEYPNDNRLMLVSPFISLAAFVIIWGLVYLVAGHYAHPFMGGVATCYMFYDWLHYASHNYNFDNRIFQILKAHHMRHHYEDNEKNYGFTTVTWDYILRTWLPTKNRS